MNGGGVIGDVSKVVLIPLVLAKILVVSLPASVSEALRNLLVVIGPVASSSTTIPKLVGISPMSEAGRSDFIVYSYEDVISSEQRILRRKSGNTQHQHKMLMQKVYTMENNKRVPLLHITEKNGKIYTKHVYKAVNAWGDSFRAQEFYTTNQQSVLDNGFDKVNEVKDDIIVDIYNGGGVTSTGDVAITPTETVSEKPKGVTQEEWDALSQEEKNKINEC